MSIQFGESDTEHVSYISEIHVDPRYIVQQNRILSDYPTMWPSERYSVKKGELYDLTPDA